MNCAAFGSLPWLRACVLLKSAVLAGAAGYAAYRFKRVSLAVMVGVVLFYQAVGTIGEWIMVGDLFYALQDFRIGIPGMLCRFSADGRLSVSC